VEELGGPETPGVGFAIGVERLLIVMEATGAFLPEEEETDIFIAYIGDEARTFAQKLVHDLRKDGFRAMLDIAERNLKGQFKYADRLSARFTAVIGDDEIKEHKFTIKDMKTSEQKQIDMDELGSVLRR
jgi:histidyl-tRNA synthetase